MTALLRFHLAAGARIALAAAVPLAGIAVVAVGMQENPAGALEQIARSIAGPAPSLGAVGALSLACLGLALWAAPRVTLGSDGWIRHLPLSRAQHRLAQIIAIACAEGPLVVAAGGLAVLESWRGGRLAWQGFLIPPVVALAAAAIAEGLRPVRRTRAWRAWPFASPPFDVRVALRAVGSRVLSVWLAGAIPMGAAMLFVTNNVLAPQEAHGAIRLGGTLATTFAFAGLADILAIRRPSWPWARSLPMTSRRRVVRDAVMLGVSCLPFLVTTAILDLRAAIAVTAVTPLLALRAVAAMRRGGEFRSAASGPVLIEGAFVSGFLALLPWLGVAALAAVPVALRAAVERERAQKVTRWSALHHVAAGDTLSWTE
jgi:energy-converting hydrogenase Eha subunit E